MNGGQDKTAGEGRDEQGRFLPGVSGNSKGGNSQTDEEKLAKKAQRETIEEYKEKLTQALPSISPILIKKAIKGDMIAIKEIHDQVMGKVMQRTDITSGGEKVVTTFNFIPNVTDTTDNKSDQETDTGVEDT